MIALFAFALATAGVPETARSNGERVGEVIRESGFQGQVIASRGEDRLFDGRMLWRDGSPVAWRWASVTKQVIAVLVMQEVAAGHIDLDRPISAYLPRFRSENRSATVRQLLQHQAGLPNPDDTPERNGVPGFYAPGSPIDHDPTTGYCAGPVHSRPGAGWTYNNCDYMVAGALLEAVTGTPWRTLVARRIAEPLGLKSLAAFPSAARIVRSHGGRAPEPAFDLATFGSAAALHGTAEDMWRFDRALMTGKLLPSAARAEMWRADPKLGFMALGQWVFSAPLRGCSKPIRIVERRGEIGGIGVRNFILPDADMVVLAFTNRPSFDFGEVWQGRGMSYDLLSAAACGQ